MVVSEKQKWTASASGSTLCKQTATGPDIMSVRRRFMKHDGSSACRNGSISLTIKILSIPGKTDGLSLGEKLVPNVHSHHCDRWEGGLRIRLFWSQDLELS